MNSRVFIYSWEILNLSAPFKVEAYGLDQEGKSVTFTVTHHRPYCYLADISDRKMDYLIYSSGISPINIRKEVRTSTLDITSKKTYTRVSFITHRDMGKFVQHLRKQEHFMDEVDPLVSFLSCYQFSFTGWYSFEGFRTGREHGGNRKWEKKGVHDTFGRGKETPTVSTDSDTNLGESIPIIHLGEIPVQQLIFHPEITQVTHPKMACIDIETYSSTGYGMPKPFRRKDTIEMVSIIFKRYLVDEWKYYLLYVGDEKLDELTIRRNFKKSPVDESDQESRKGHRVSGTSGKEYSGGKDGGRKEKKTEKSHSRKSQREKKKEKTKTNLSETSSENSLVEESMDETLHEQCHWVACQDEIELIQKMGDILRKESPDVITGYNIFGFDLGYIISRLKIKLLPLPNMSKTPRGITTTYKVDWSSSAYGQNVYDRVQISGRVFIDLMLFFKRMKLDKYSLDFVSKTFLGYGKKDMTPEEMWKYFSYRNKKGKRDRKGLRKVAEYCIYDSVLTLKLFDKFYLWTEVCELSYAMKCSIEDIYTRGEQLKVLNQIIYKCTEHDWILIQRPNDKAVERKYEGAYVLEPTKGIFEGCTVMDFQSLYPSILIAYNICPSTYLSTHLSEEGNGNTRGEYTGGTKFKKKEKEINLIQVSKHRSHSFRKSPKGILPELVQRLLDERALVKNQIKELVEEEPLTRMILDRRQNALKICANSIYGITGFVGNRYLGHVPTAESITSKGRQLLEEVIQKLQDNFPIQVVYGDTDSCMIYHNGCTDKEMNVRLAHEMVDFINRELPPPLKLLVEKYYEKMAFLTKKRYIMFDGTKLTSKGVASARRNYCMFTRNLYSKMMELIFLENDQEKIVEFLMGELYQLVSGKTPLDDLIMTKSIKPLESYKGTNVPHVLMAKRLLEENTLTEIGSRLEYLFVKVPGSRLQGEKMFTPQEVIKWDLEVDYNYYIEKQLVATLDELLSLIGYKNYLKRFLEIIKS